MTKYTLLHDSGVCREDAGRQVSACKEAQNGNAVGIIARSPHFSQISSITAAGENQQAEAFPVISAHLSQRIGQVCRYIEPFHLLPKRESGLFMKYLYRSQAASE